MRNHLKAKRTKLALAMCGALVATGMVVNSASGAGAPQNYVVVSNHDIGTGRPSVAIRQYAADNSVIGSTDPSSGTHFWYVNANAAYVTVEKSGRKFRIPESGTLNQATQLPVCFRVSNSGELHHVTDQPCSNAGVSEGTWK